MNYIDVNYGIYVPNLRTLDYKGIEFVVELVNQNKMIIRTVNYPIVLEEQYCISYSEAPSIEEQVKKFIDEANVEIMIEKIKKFL